MNGFSGVPPSTQAGGEGGSFAFAVIGLEKHSCLEFVLKASEKRGAGGPMISH